MRSPRLWLEIAFATGRLPAVPLVAGLLLIAASTLRLHVLPEQRREQVRLGMAMDDARAAALRTRAIAGVAPTDESQRWHAFLASLGPAERSEEQLRTLFLLAEDAGLTLRQADYRESAASFGQVRVLEFVLPVEGRYEQIRQFAEQLLLRVPFCALDSIRLARANAGEARVEAKLRFTLYLRDTSARTAVDRDGQARGSGR
ncbi:hypothetical protein [Roseateles noduli]|uniref:hypothetical protein n=1 Tax=Roseateles noduli TaxID=2052484 RepID=UPI003D65893F